MTDKLSEYTFDEIEIGLAKEFHVIITEQLVNDFAKISGDYSPIHMDEEYAKSEVNHRFQIPENSHWSDLQNQTKNIKFECRLLYKLFAVVPFTVDFYTHY